MKIYRRAGQQRVEVSPREAMSCALGRASRGTEGALEGLRDEVMALQEIVGFLFALAVEAGHVDARAADTLLGYRFIVEESE